MPRLVAPLATERHWHTSDVGSSPAQLRSLFEGHPWDFDGLEDDWWPPVPETDEQFYGRLMKLGHWLLERPEENITLVCHVRAHAIPIPRGGRARLHARGVSLTSARSRSRSGASSTGSRSGTTRRIARW